VDKIAVVYLILMNDILVDLCHVMSNLYDY